MNRTTRTFLAAISFLLISTCTTTILGQTGKCKEEKVGKTYMSICGDNIITEKKKLLITTKAVIKKVAGKNELKIVHYYKVDKRASATDEAFLEYAKFLRNLEVLNVLVNGKEFTGVIKVAIPFYNGGSDTPYEGYDIRVFEYKEGELVKLSKLEDVDLEKEKTVVRPG